MPVVDLGAFKGKRREAGAEGQADAEQAATRKLLINRTISVVVTLAIVEAAPSPA